MEVTFDDLATDWDWVNTHADDKFKRLDAEEYPPLHQYILDRKSTFVCHLNSDGTAGGVEPHDSLDRDNGANSESSKESEWHGRANAFLEAKHGNTTAGAELNMKKGSASISGRGQIDKKGNVSGRVDAGWDF